MWKNAIKSLSLAVTGGAAAGGSFYAFKQLNGSQEQPKPVILNIEVPDKANFKPKTEELHERRDNFNSWTHLVQTQKWDDNWDNMKLHNKKQKEEMIQKDENYKVKNTSRQIFLVRHGQYDHSAGDTDDKHLLTELGHTQGRKAGLKLADYFLELKAQMQRKYADNNDGKLEGFVFPKVTLVHSTMIRAKETHDEIVKVFKEKGLDFESTGGDDLIREADVYPRTPSSSKYEPEERAAMWQDSAIAEAAFRKYFKRQEVKEEHDSFEVIVCHGNIIRYMMLRALQFPPEGWLRFCPYNGSITFLNVRKSGNVGLRWFGDVGFLNADEITFNVRKYQLA